MIVYYAAIDNQFVDQPEKAYKDAIIANNYQNLEREVSFLRCPAIRDYYKNTFVIKSNCDFSFTINKEANEVRTHEYDDDFYDRALLIRSISHRIVTIKLPNLIFFADKPVIAEQIPAAFHKNGLNDVSLFCGAFDVGRHFRRLEAAFAANRDMTISIEEGKPLYYLRFLTDEKIEFRQFRYTEKISSFQNMFKVQRDHTKKITPLNWYYERFGKSGLRKKLLAELEKEAF